MKKAWIKISTIWMVLVFMMIPIEAKVTEAIIDITGMSIKEIQEQVDLGMISYQEITQIYLDRIAAYAQLYDVVISVNPNAIEEAAALDVQYQETGRTSEVFGIPILVKDNIDVKGMPTTAGATGLFDNYPNEDADVIKTLRDKGVIFIAKTNMDEFAFNASFSRSGFGTVKNAYDTLYSAYGSSGGTAAGVALDLAVAGLGTDTGTSIRVPASANNLYGLRPTKESVSTDGIIKFEFLRDMVGPMTKYADDAKLLYEAMANVSISLDLEDLTGITVGVLSSQVNASSGFIRELFEKKINQLEALGATIKYVSSFSMSYSFNSGNFCYDFNQHIKNTEGPIGSLNDLIRSGKYTQYISGYGGYYCDHDYTKTDAFKQYLSARNNNIVRANNQFNSLGIDVLVYPTIQEPLMTLDKALYNNVKTYSYMIAPQTGFPSISVPMGFYEDLPYGMEIVSQSSRDDLLLEMASLLENHYVIPDPVGALYTPIDEIPALLDILDTTHLEVEYEPVITAIQGFIDNYSDVEDKSKVAQSLIEEYEDVPRIIEENIRIARAKKIRTYAIVGASIVGLIVIIYIVKRKTRKYY